MARLPSIVVADIPHQVTQWGNRRQRIFHTDDDYEMYLDFLAERGRHCNVLVWRTA